MGGVVVELEVDLVCKDKDAVLDDWVHEEGAELQVVDIFLPFFAVSLVEITNYLNNIVEHIQFGSNWELEAWVIKHINTLNLNYIVSLVYQQSIPANWLTLNADAC